MGGIVEQQHVAVEHAFAESEAVARARRRVERALARYRGAAARLQKLTERKARPEKIHAARTEMWALHPPLEQARRRLAEVERRSRKGARGRRR